MTSMQGGPGGRRVPAELVPVVLLAHTVRCRAGRVRSAVRERAAGGAGRERGAISTELALVVIALVALAAIVLAAITSLGKRTADKVKGL